MQTAGGRVACGDSKCSSSASFRLARASSSVSPWLAMSSSKHWETYHFPSRQTVAVNGRFVTSLFHRQGCSRPWRREVLRGVVQHQYPVVARPARWRGEIVEPGLLEFRDGGGCAVARIVPPAANGLAR